MSSAHEEDVVIAFRQAVQEELLRVQEGGVKEEDQPLMKEGEPVETTLRRLCGRHAQLEHEVALLRTIVLRMVSDPIDNE